MERLTTNGVMTRMQCIHIGSGDTPCKVSVAEKPSEAGIKYGQEYIMNRRTLFSLSLASFILIAISSSVFGVVQGIWIGPIEGILAYLIGQAIALIILMPVFFIDAPAQRIDKKNPLSRAVKG